MGFARGAWRFLVGVKDLLVLLLLLLFFGLLWAALSQSAPVRVADGSALVLHLDGVMVDQASEQDPTSLLLGATGLAEYQVRDVVRAIDRAAADGRIARIVLDLDTFVGAGTANLEAVGRALGRFKAAGKPIEAFATAYTDDSYYLAARADTIWMDPLGGVLVSGPGGSGLYFGDALEKLNIDIEVFRVGTFKSAVEPFLRNSASPEAKAADQALVDGIWTRWQADTKAARPKADFTAWLRALPQRIAASEGDQAEAARDSGLVDKLGARDEFEAAMVEELGAGQQSDRYPFKAVTLNEYRRAGASVLPSSGPAVGVVYVSGGIVDGEAPRGTAGGTSIADAIDTALAEQSDLKALVVRIDSPGGSVLASETIRRALLRAKAQGLPVVASMGPVAASGGYWVATPAQKIFAEATTVTGSIGVFAVLPTFPRALERLGIGSDGVKATPYSGEPNVLGGLGSETRALLQISVEDIYRRFIGIVSEARDMPAAEVDRVGQGRVWTGETALKLKLVDEIGGLDAAVAHAAKLGGVGGEVRTIDIETRRSDVAALLGSFMGPEDSAGGDNAAVRDGWSGLVQRERMRVLAMLGDLRVLGSGATMQAACLECAGMGSPRPAQAASIETALRELAGAR
jgi:protease-4